MERQERIQLLVEECIDRRIAGEGLSDKQIIADHPELLPELRTELRNLAVVEGAVRRVKNSSDAVDLTQTHAVAAADVASESGATGPVDLFAGYEILNEIERGGQGVVYLARQQGTERQVAIKVMTGGSFASPRELARFEREVQVLGALQHPNIVTIHESGVGAAGSFYYVMDYIAGKPLDEYMEATRRPANKATREAGAGSHPPGMSIVETLKLFAKICDAVNAAHLLGIIHRDLKPGNVRVDENGEPRVLDFGLAKMEADDSGAPAMTMTGQFVGSVPWASPEQAEGGASKVDVRTDVYSLGVILFQMLTGVFPYEVVGSIRDVLDRILSAEPYRPRSLRRQIDDEVETIVLKCLQKECERRYQSAGELARDIRHYLAGEPIEAKRDSGLYVLRKTLKRHKFVVTVAAVFVVIITASSIALAFMYEGQKREHARAEAARKTEKEQRLLAEENEKLARDEADKYRGNSKFLRGLLSSPDPRKVRGRDYKVSDLLGEAARRLESGELADQPKIEAEMRATIGASYFGLGRYADAEPHLTKALKLRRQFRGKYDVKYSLLTLADLMRVTGRPVETEKYVREALAIARGLYGDTHPDVATCLHNLGGALWVQGKFAEAESLFRDSLSMRRSALGNRHEHVANSLDALALCLQKQGELDEAEPLLREALALRRELLPSDHPNLSTNLRNLAYVLTLMKRHAEAETLLSEALEAERRTLSADHPSLGVTLMVLAVTYLDQDRAAEAEPLLRECLRIRQKSLAGQWQVHYTQNTLGGCLAAQGRFDEAEPLLLNSYQALKEERYAPVQRKREAGERVVKLYEQWGRTEEAAHWREVLEAIPQ